MLFTLLKLAAPDLIHLGRATYLAALSMHNLLPTWGIPPDAQTSRIIYLTENPTSSNQPKSDSSYSYNQPIARAVDHLHRYPGSKQTEYRERVDD